MFCHLLAEFPDLLDAGIHIRETPDLFPSFDSDLKQPTARDIVASADVANAAEDQRTVQSRRKVFALARV